MKQWLSTQADQAVDIRKILILTMLFFAALC